jgi:hypothetical protein
LLGCGLAATFFAIPVSARVYDLPGGVSSSAERSDPGSSVMAQKAASVGHSTPVDVVQTPTAGQQIPDSMIRATGTAKDNVGVASVWYQLGATGWFEATTTNRFTNWTTPWLILAQGSNQIATYAVDTAGNKSSTNTVKFLHVPSALLSLSLDGPGTVTIAGPGISASEYSGQYLTVGKKYTLTAKPIKSCRFLGWSGSVSNDTGSLTFLMQSNLDIVAHFAPIATLSTTSVIPFEYLRINGGFKTNATTAVEFALGHVAISVTPTIVSSNVIRVSAPPLLQGRTFVAGLASVTVIQDDGIAVIRNPVASVKIANLPSVKLPPGTLTASFANVAKLIMMSSYTNIHGSALDTDETANNIGAGLAFFDAVSASIKTAALDRRLGTPVSSNSSDYSVTLSVSTVQNLDSIYAGVIAAGAKNSTDPQIVLAYKNWNDAIELPSSGKFDSAAQLKLIQAEESYQQAVSANSKEITDTLNTMMAPLTATVATVSLAALASGDPAAIAAAAELAICSDALTAGLIFGLALDGEYYALMGNNQQYQVYLSAEYSLSKELFVSKALSAVLGLVAGESAGTALTSIRDIQMAQDTMDDTIQNQDQPQVQADVHLTIPSNIPKGTYQMSLSGSSTATCCDAEGGCNTTSQSYSQNLGAIPVVDTTLLQSALESAFNAAVAGAQEPGCSTFVSYSDFQNSEFSVTYNLGCTSPGCTSSSTYTFTLRK